MIPRWCGVPITRICYVVAIAFEKLTVNKRRPSPWSYSDLLVALASLGVAALALYGAWKLL